MHDIRHHNAVMAEYVRRGQQEELLQYLQEYDRVTDQDIALDNGQKIYLPRGTYRCLRERYFEYYCQKG